MNRQDEILQMFFDKDFIPQTYLDILLSSKEMSFKELQLVSTSLLSRLDCYTSQLTGELEDAINKLQKPTEVISYPRLNHKDNMETTKLEYYLDTLANSMKLLESDITKIDTQLMILNEKFVEGDAIITKLNKFELINSRLMYVLDVFQQLETILSISVDGNERDLGKINTNYFKLVLETLKDSIIRKLNESVEHSQSKKYDPDIIKRIDYLVNLKPALKGLTKFYPYYFDFCKEIIAERNKYLDETSLIETFTKL